MLRFGGSVAMIDVQGVVAAYIDTNVFIYFMEAEGPFGDRAKNWITAFKGAEIPIVTSRLTLLECMYGPAKQGNSELVSLYRKLLCDASKVEMVELEQHILEDAAMRGGQLGLKLPDAIHYFTALHARCDLLLTNDTRFRSTAEMRVESMNPAKW